MASTKLVERGMISRAEAPWRSDRQQRRRARRVGAGLAPRWRQPRPMPNPTARHAVCADAWHLCVPRGMAASLVSRAGISRTVPMLASDIAMCRTRGARLWSQR